MTARDRLLLIWSGAPPGPGPCVTPSLGPEDDAHLARIHHPAALAARLQGRRLLMEALELLDLPTRGVRLVSDALGRPLLSLPGVSLSFSYTDRAMCLVHAAADGRAAPVGVDLEEPRTRLLPLMPGEAVPATVDGAREILRRWCVREAVLKAHGTGLRIRPDLVDAGEPGQENGVSLVDGRPYRWHCPQLDGAVCCCALPQACGLLPDALTCLRSRGERALR